MTSVIERLSNLCLLDENSMIRTIRCVHMAFEFLTFEILAVETSYMSFCLVLVVIPKFDIQRLTTMVLIVLGA